MKQPGALLLENLAEAYRKNPHCWVGSCYARDDEGFAVPLREVKSGAKNVTRACGYTGLVLLSKSFGDEGEVVLNQALRMLYNFLGGEHQPGTIFTWNDVPGRTVEEVIETLEEAALKGDVTRRPLRVPIVTLVHQIKPLVEEEVSSGWSRILVAARKFFFGILDSGA